MEARQGDVVVCCTVIQTVPVDSLCTKCHVYLNGMKYDTHIIMKRFLEVIESYATVFG